MRRSIRRIFVSDCEGPISKNDNAFEIASHYLPEGPVFFTLVSAYDDILADIVKRPSYKAGDTLKLILPFLKAYGVTNKTITEYSSRNIHLFPHAKKTLRYVRRIMPSFIISTSYEQYMRVLCDFLGFPFENVHCTKLDLDIYTISKKEATRLKYLREEMVKMPIPEIPKHARSINDFPKMVQETVKRLDEIFWQELSGMTIGRILREIKPIGGKEKARALENIVERLKVNLDNVMYVGDSITDSSAFELVRKGGGVTVSFNGNAYAIRQAEISVLSGDAAVSAILADAFKKYGKGFVMKLINDWKPNTLEKVGIAQPLKTYLSKSNEKFPKAEIITSENIERLIKESSAFRETIRGEAVGKLG
jgi:energy-converting hydrogenase A subunit R